MKRCRFIAVAALGCLLACVVRADRGALAAEPSASKAGTAARRLLYVATPGVRDYLEYGGHGLVVFDIDDGHKFVRRIKTAGVDAAGKPLNVKGICAAPTQCAPM